LTKDEIIKLVIDVFNAATERDITTGDNLEIFLIEKGKAPERRIIPLRKD